MNADVGKRRRYSVAFVFKNGSRDVLTAWEWDPDSAVEAARNWLEFSQDFPTDEAVEVVVEVLGDESDPGDIGIADMNDVVNHRSFSSEGEPVRTLFRGEPEEVLRLTTALRTSDAGNWPLIRSFLRENLVDPSEVAAVGTASWRPERPQQADMVTRDGRVFLFLDGSSPIDDPSKPPKLGPHFSQAPDRPDWGPDIELGLEMLERGDV